MPVTSSLQRFYRTSVLLLGLLLLWPALAAAETLDQLVITGQYRWKAQTQNLVGSVQQYKLDTGLEPGNLFAQSLALSTFGPLRGGWYLNGRYDDSLPLPERWELRVNKAANELYAGTRRFSLASPGLLQWGRMITGLQTALVTPGAGTLGMRIAVGAPLGVPVRVELTGKGLVGPYLLPAQYLPVIVGSETIYVDGIAMRRDEDYEIDADLGGVTFRTPVAPTSQIVAEYEYQAPQPRRISVATGRWKEERFTFDILAAEEHAMMQDDNPLEFVPPDDAAGVEAELPTGQRMDGAALAWRLTPSFTLTGSWLTTHNTVNGEEQPAAAWQTGGEWQGGSLRGGWDYRAATPGFRPIGRPPADSGYQTLSAGYEYQFAAPWHSKFNVLWQSGPGLDQAEHVLTYAQGNSLVGWSLGLASSTAASAQLNTGVLGVTNLGPWNLEAERRGVISRWGAPGTGDILSTTRLAANLVRYPKATGSVQWKQDVSMSSDGGKDAASVWRLVFNSKAAADSSAVLPDAEQLNWRLQWQQSHVDTAPLGSNNYQPVSRFSYGRGEIEVPFGNSHLFANLLGELRQRTAQGDTSTDTYAKAGLRYINQTQWNLYAGALQSRTSVEQLGQQQLSAGLETHIPIFRHWTYHGVWQGFAEASDETGSGERTTSDQAVQGLTWSNSGWSVGVEHTSGLLVQPAQPGDTEEDQPPLAQLPVGRRVGFQVDHHSEAAQVTAQLARDWETSARTWRTKLQATAKVGVSELNGEYTAAWRQGADGWQRQEYGKLRVQWWLSPQTVFSISGRTDIRQSVQGNSDYRANGIFTEWSTRF